MHSLKIKRNYNCRKYIQNNRKSVKVVQCELQKTVECYSPHSWPICPAD